MDTAEPRGGEAPLILTLTLDDESFAFFDNARRRHFPPARNHIPAHVTLFHKLPGAEEGAIQEMLAAAARRYAPFRISAPGLRFLGLGVAYTIEAPELDALHAELASAFAPWLSPQDRQPFRPHVTIQNKAPAAEAKALYALLQASHQSIDGSASGLSLWHYAGGPWRAAGRFRFEGRVSKPA